MKHLIVVIALLIPTAAMAKGECKEDKEKFCKDATDNIACLDQHKAEISEACKAKLEARANENKGSAKMGEGEGTHTGSNQGAPENDTQKIDQPERRNPTTGGETPKQ